MNAASWGIVALLLVLALGTIAWACAPAWQRRRVRKSGPYTLPADDDDWLESLRGHSTRERVVYKPHHHRPPAVQRRRDANKRARAARRVTRARVK